MDEGFARIGTTILCPGEPVGNGLMENVAKEFGLRPGTPVGTGMVDAHAGGLGESVRRDSLGGEGGTDN